MINNDADEFWFPTVDADLAHRAGRYSEEVRRCSARRFNHVPRPIDGRPFWERMTIRNTRSVNEVGNPLGPKLAHRADPDIVVRQGNHEVESERLGGPLDDGRIEILHFPLRTYAQFENKVICGGGPTNATPSFPGNRCAVAQLVHPVEGGGTPRRVGDVRVQ